MAIASTHEPALGLEPPAPTPHENLTRAGGWWTLALALIMLSSVAEGMHAASWSEGMAVVRLAIMGGGLLGFALALSRFGGLFATLYGLLAGVFWVTISLERVLLPGLGTHDAVEELLLRNAGWFLELTKGGAGADNLVFVTQLGFLGWWLGLFATWNLFRHHAVLSAVIPAGVALLVNQYYSPINLNGYLVVFLAAVLLLAVRIELSKNEQRWQMSRIRYAPDIYIDFLKAGVAFAAVVILLSWAMPNVASRTNLERLVRPLQRPWKAVEDTWTRMYQAVNYPGVAPAATRYGRNLALGGPVSLSDRPIFEGQFPERTYWRAATYDRYDGRGWSSTDTETTIIEHAQWLGEPVFAARAEMTATLRPLESGQDAILAPPQPLRVSLPVDADYSPISEDGGLITVSRMSSRIELGPRAPYSVVSGVTQAPVNLLQADNTEYPPWVAERYLQVPPSVSERVVELAREITAPYSTPYDKASAIESYLRTYPYSTDIAAPPEGMDGVEYFLFDVRQGYCDYYASAMAVMLRTIGIPSRLAAGYAPGELVAGDDKPVYTDEYRVLERDAHAWVEVFFPTYGWIQFEPTGSQPLVQRVVAAEPERTDSTPAPPIPEDEDLRDLRNLGTSEDSAGLTTARSPLVRWVRTHQLAFGIALAAVALLVIAALYRRQREKVFLTSPELLAGLLGRVGAWASRLRIPWPASHTPMEHAARFGREVPEAEPVVTRIATLFAAQRYGRQQPQPETVQTAVREWANLRVSLWKRWLRKLARPKASYPAATPAPDGRAPSPRDLDRDPPQGTSQRH
jgi:transglutaminase-like putative cysteine protease